MNVQHLKAFIWLRWRLFRNQVRRGGTLNAVLALVLAALAVIASVSLFVAFFLVGMFGLANVAPPILLFVWDGLVIAFLFSWALGTLVELQRSDVLTLDRFMHLPVSLRGVFLINFLSSLFSLSMMFFLPAMLALGLGLTLGRGPALAVVLPALAAFLLMVTALTYQFQGWLASLMVNKRRRRTVLVLLTTFMILLCQIPNLVNLYGPWRKHGQDDSAVQQREQLEELNRSFLAREITSKEFEQRKQEMQKEIEARNQESNEQTLRQVEDTTHFVNLVLPVGWLPLGAETAAKGQLLPALLGTLGMTAIGLFSLWRSYRTTLRLYTGDFTSRGKAKPAAPAPAAAASAAAQPARVGLLERKVPLVSEQAAAVALNTLQSLLRAPEIKMAVLSQVIVLAVIGSTMFTSSTSPPEYLRPLMASGPMAMILLLMVQMVGNQFGLDRNGFRAYVLSAALRRDILLGKNLAAAPLAWTLSFTSITIVQILRPMRLDHYLSLVPQMVTMYLLFCMLANWLSILSPMRLRPGSLKATRIGAVAVLLQFAFVLLLPVAMAPALLPLACEYLLAELAGLKGVPICLALSLLEVAVVGFLYRLMLNVQGKVLQVRELQILQTVTIKDD